MTQSIAIINKDKCKPKKCNNECKRFCPPNLSGQLCIEIEDTKVVINEDLCISCGACVKKCPFDAIKMVKLPSELSNEMVHLYGENMFRLYKLPYPKIGKIIGILGPNGCGKSTIMNILSKNILPNFGNLKIGNCDNEKNILNKCKGNELHKYLSLLYNDKLIVNIKKQDIINIIKKVKKTITVKDILERFTLKEKFNRISTILNLSRLMNKEVLKLSGGELQLLICSINLLKDGNLYIFDEPTNFLDIEYRIKIANLITELNDNENVYIFIVDHDLSILDFVSDQIHIIYGEPGAYGVVSTLYSSLEGINIYFDGYIPADNIRFRPEPYKLKSSIIEYDNHIKSNTIKFEIEPIDINFDTFNLKINKFELTSNINMVIILGKNGTGKTTFLNYLYNNYKGISYKPQFENNEKTTTVINYLYLKIKSSMFNQIFINDVINPLNIKNLYDKQLNTLSGGEFQRLNIVVCLGTPADIYLIDEPSASLDIEYRFIVTKVIKRFLLQNEKFGFIIEHDILMATTLAKEESSRILLFKENKQNFDKKYCDASLLNFNTGINLFLQDIDATFRIDRNNKRPRLNKYNSINDKEQKLTNKYFSN